MESCSVPPGFRFHPTDEELVGYYLRKKIASQKIDLEVIKDIDLYRIEPYDLQEICRIGYEEQNEWYFFSHKDKKYPTGTRTNRATMTGFWKATGRDKTVYDKTKLIGMRKTLVFYKGRAPNGRKSDWIIHEYRLESDENAPPKEEGWVICRAFKKRATGQVVKHMETWNSNYFYDHELVNSIQDPLDYMSKQQQQQHNIFKQEQDYIKSNQFIRFPQLEKTSSFMSSSITSMENESNYNISLENAQMMNIKKKKMVKGDWRELDKFVASQFMNHEDFGVSSFADYHEDPMEDKEYDDIEIDSSSSLFLSEKDEENRFISEFLSNNSDYENGILRI